LFRRVPYFWDAFRVFQTHEYSVREFSSKPIRFLKTEIWSDHSVCGDIIILYECESWFQGAFPKMRKATISFVMSVRPSVIMEQLGSHWTDFHEI